MFLVSIALLIIGFITAMVAGIWMLVLAFQRHVLWGLAYIFIPFAALAFLIMAWDEAKRPFFWSLIGLAFCFGGIQAMPKNAAPGSSMAQFQDALKASGLPVRGSATPAAGSSSPRVADQGMFRAAKEAQLKIKLVNLQTRETELRQRKAELSPNDKEGAAALAREIKKYNDDLQPVLEELKLHPELAK